MLIQQNTQTLYASHHQFYVEDGKHPGDTGDPSFWTPEASRDGLAETDGTLGIGTASYAHVRVCTEIHDAEPPLDLEFWDHVVEASLNLKSGTLRVIGCLDETGVEFALPPGDYRVRCGSANLAGAADSGEGADWYQVQVWPAPPAPRRVLKRAGSP